VDEVCDLTLEELGKVVGQDKLDEASLRVNVYGNIKNEYCDEGAVVVNKMVNELNGK